MKKQLSFLAIAAGAIVLAAAPSFAAAPTGTQFNPHTATNPAGGGPVQPSSVAGDPNQFSVGGTIDEFIQITSVDDTLELGNLGGPQTAGKVTSTSGPGTDSSATAVTIPSGNGTAGVEGRSNSYINVQVNYGSNLTNSGVDGNAATTGDNFTLPTKFRAAVKGIAAFQGANPTGDLTPGAPTAQSAYVNYGNTYSPFSPAVASGTTGYVTFAPGEVLGAKVMAEATRNGLNDYKGNYSTTIGLNYFKF